MEEKEENPHLKEIAEKLPFVPQSPGCYLWYGEAPASPGEKSVLYVGKSVNLRSRLRQYLNSDDFKTRFLMARVTHFEWVVTTNEVEALILENTLIKKYNPPYNVRLKDDKRYPWLALTLSEPFPRLILTRKKTSPKNLYFGPFSDVRAARSTMELVQRIFPLRRRPQKLPLKKPGRPCLNYHMGRCLAPCAEKISGEEYMRLVHQVKDFLEEKDDAVQKDLMRQMEEYSQKQEYEKAARIRDMLRDIELTHSEQLVEGADESENFDAVGIHTTTRDQLARELKLEENILSVYGGNAVSWLGQIVLLRVRHGKLTGKQTYAMSEGGAWEPDEFLEGFLRDYYLQSKDVPPRIFLSEDLKSAMNWEEGLHKENGIATRIVPPESEEYQEKTGLIQMAVNNAQLSLRERVLNEKLRNQKIGLRQIQKFVGLKELPETIECYDISNFHGEEAVGSGVMLKDGLPHKPGYRRYKIKTIEGANDPAMMHEVLSRRFARIAKGEIKPPSLIVIDGGKTQLGAAKRAREENGLQVPLIGLAKREEEIYTEDGDILKFDKDSPGMLVLRLARDEAHRFGVSYHRTLRMKKFLSSLYDNIKGVGEERSKLITNHLRKLDLGSMSSEDIASSLEGAGIPSSLATEVAGVLLSKAVE